MSKWSIIHDSAWFKVGERRYRHYCGAEIEKRGNLWMPKTEFGNLLPSCATALDALGLLREQDYNSFWVFGQFAVGSHVFGVLKYGDAVHKIRPVCRGDKDELFVFCSPEGAGFPDFLNSFLCKQFRGRSHCVRCSSPMANLQMRRVHFFDCAVSGQSSYLACTCGYPVWRMETKLYSATNIILERTAASWRRRQKLKAAGGKHGRREILAIQYLQGGRCIYCDSKFTDENLPSEDHVVPVSEGGSDSAHNIVLACRGCNSRRGTIPFRTYCRLLSPTDNRRIALLLGRRVERLTSEEAASCFSVGLVRHDPKHPRFLDILKTHSAARRNAEANRLLPGNVKAILGMTSMARRRLEPSSGERRA